MQVRGFAIEFIEVLSKIKEMLSCPELYFGTWYHDIKSIKTHCGTSTARLDKKSCFGCRTIMTSSI